MNRKLIRPNLSELKDKLGMHPKSAGVEPLTPAPPTLTPSGEPKPATNPAAATVWKTPAPRWNWLTRSAMPPPPNPMNPPSRRSAPNLA